MARAIEADDKMKFQEKLKKLEEKIVTEQAKDPGAVCGNIWFNGTDEQRGSFAGGTKGRGRDEKPPKEWMDDCSSKVSESFKTMSEKIEQEGEKWVVKSEDGKVLGTHDSKPDAVAQLQAIEISKHG